jgi:hypothetical protein
VASRGRGAPLARRDEGAYCWHATEEQRSQPGCIGRESVDLTIRGPSVANGVNVRCRLRVDLVTLKQIELAESFLSAARALGAGGYQTRTLQLVLALSLGASARAWRLDRHSDQLRGAIRRNSLRSPCSNEPMSELAIVERDSRRDRSNSSASTNAASLTATPSVLHGDKHCFRLHIASTRSSRGECTGCALKVLRCLAVFPEVSSQHNALSVTRIGQPAQVLSACWSGGKPANVFICPSPGTAT